MSIQFFLGKKGAEKTTIGPGFVCYLYSSGCLHLPRALTHSCAAPPAKTPTNGEMKGIHPVNTRIDNGLDERFFSFLRSGISNMSLLPYFSFSQGLYF